MLHKVCKTKFCVSESEHVRKCHVQVSWQMFTVRLNLWTNFIDVIVATYFMCPPPPPPCLFVIQKWLKCAITKINIRSFRGVFSLLFNVSQY